MALKLTVRANETVYINGAEICNAGSTATLIVKNHCRILRGSEMISESEATSLCSKMVLALQQIALKENPFEEMNELSQLAVQILQIMPSVAPNILEIQQLLNEKKTHIALKKGKALMALETASIESSGEARRA